MNFWDCKNVEEEEERENKKEAGNGQRAAGSVGKIRKAVGCPIVIGGRGLDSSGRSGKAHGIFTNITPFFLY